MDLEEEFTQTRIRAVKMAQYGKGEEALNLLDRAEARIYQMQLSRDLLGIVWYGRSAVYSIYEQFLLSLDAAYIAEHIYTQHKKMLQAALVHQLSINNLGMLYQIDEALNLANKIRKAFLLYKDVMGQEYEICLATTYANEGKALIRAERFTMALERIGAAYNIFARLKILPAEEAYCLNDMGFAAECLELYDDADNYYQKGLEIFVELNSMFASKPWMNLAFLETKRSDFGKALAYIDATKLWLAKFEDPYEEGVLALAEGKIRFLLGQHEMVQVLLKNEIVQFDQKQDWRELAEAAVLLAQSYIHQKDYEEGLSWLDNAYKATETQDAPLLKADIELRKGHVYYNLKAFPEAIDAAEQALNEFQEHHLNHRIAQAHTLIGLALVASPSDRAFSHFQQALSLAEGVSPDLCASCYHGLGKLHSHRNDWFLAQGFYEKAINLQQTLRRQFSAHENQAGYAAGYLDLFSEFFVVLHALQATGQQIFSWVNRLNARALADLLRKQPAAGTGAQDIVDRLLQQRSQIQHKLDIHLAQHFTAYHDFVPVVEQQSHSINLYDQKLKDLKMELQQINQQIQRQQAPQFDWYDGFADSIIYLPDLLDSDTLLISYYNAGGDLYALTATHESVKTHYCNQSLQGVEEHWQNSVEYLQDPDDEYDAQRRLSQLWEQLIDPIQHRMVGKRRLMIIPTQGLFNIPFSCLFDPNCEEYMIQNWEIQTIPSIDILTICHSRALAKGVPLFAGYAGQSDADDYLPAVKDEISNLTQLFSINDELLDDALTAKKVFEMGAGRSVIHLAGHIYYDEDDPLLSGMPLADESWLRASDLYLHYEVFNGSCIVLSGCESGRSDALGGDVLGLLSAFLYAGAKAVVAGLWKVDDEATSLLMMAFYKGLKQGMKLSEALSYAQLVVFHDTRFTHPYYWGAFQVLGDDFALLISK